MYSCFFLLLKIRYKCPFGKLQMFEGCFGKRKTWNKGVDWQWQLAVSIPNFHFRKLIVSKTPHTYQIFPQLASKWSELVGGCKTLLLIFDTSNIDFCFEISKHFQFKASNIDLQWKTEKIVKWKLLSDKLSKDGHIFQA